MAIFNQFTEKEKQFIRENFEQMTLRQMAAALNRSEGGVKTWSLKLGLRRRNRFDWTPERVRIFEEMYPNHSAREIAERLETTIEVIYAKSRHSTVRKSPEYLAALNKQMGENLQKNGYGTRFEKGQKPWCFGKKIGSHPNSAKTQFKKGEMPHNHQPIGTILPVSTQPYLKIKIAEPNKWEMLHRHNWKKANGEIPKGFCLVFRDGNAHNCAVENLELISRSELQRRNSIHNLPEDLRTTIQTIGHLRRTINRRIKKYAKQ